MKAEYVNLDEILNKSYMSDEGELIVHVDDITHLRRRHINKVKTAKWIYNPQTDLSNCSNCNSTCFHDDYGRIETKYCPECGAKMKGVF